MNTNFDTIFMSREVEKQMGDKFKEIEKVSRTIEYVENTKAIVIRVDGRAFHTFTRNMERPYSSVLEKCREAAATAVVTSLHPTFAYYQSDEISFVWLVDQSKPNSQHPFNGRVDKLISVCASLTSVAFYQEYIKHEPDCNKLPHFDGRLAGTFDSSEEAMHCVMWRENDAMRNSLQMLAQSLCSHNELQNKNCNAQYTMCNSAGVDWLTAVPVSFRRGVYLRSTRIDVELTECQRNKIPEKYRPPVGTLVPRTIVTSHSFDDWSVRDRLSVLENEQ